jgi:DNA-binding beta-propeller fold protein YncE
MRQGLGLTQDKVETGNCRSSAYDLSLRQAFTSAREPDGIALTPDGRYFVTADEDNLTSVNNQSYDGIPISPHGSRSISVFDAATGSFLGDSGDSIEESVIALGLPQRCNSKGPEPEVVTVARVGDRTLAFVAIERSDAVTIHDISDPTKIQRLDTVILNPEVVRSDKKAEFEPEGLEFIPATNQLVVSNPGVGSVSLINLTQP